MQRPRLGHASPAPQSSASMVPLLSSPFYAFFLGYVANFVSFRQASLTSPLKFVTPCLQV